MNYLATVVSGNHSNEHGSFKPGEAAIISQLELDTFGHKFRDVEPLGDENPPQATAQDEPEKPAQATKGNQRGRRK